MRKFIRKCNDWFLHKPNKFQILRLVKNHPRGHGNIRNPSFNGINVLSLKYMFSMPNLSFTPATSLSYE